MGLYSFVLFAAIVLLACVGSASKVAAANSTAQERGIVKAQNEASTKSFARTSEPMDEGDEARGLMGEASISNILESTKWRLLAMLTRPLQEWANTGVELKVVLQRLHGGQTVDVLESSVIRTADKYINLLNEKRPNSKLSLVASLTDIYGDAVVTESLIKLQDSPGLGTLAEKLQEEQLQRWLSGNTPVAEVVTRMEVKDNKYVYGKLCILKQYLKRYIPKQSAKHSTGVPANADDDFLADNAFALAIIAKWRHKLENEQLDQLLKFVFERLYLSEDTAIDVEKSLKKVVPRDNDDAVEFLVNKYSSFYDKKEYPSLPHVTPRRT